MWCFHVVVACMCSLALVVAAQEPVAADSGLLKSLHTLATEASALAALSDHLASGGLIDREDGRDAMEGAMERGWWAVSHKLLEASTAGGVDLSSSIHQAASRIRAKLQLLTDAISKTRAMAVGIPPAFEWAQSPDSLFLNVKFSHKLDTPATLGCEVSSANFSGSNVLFVADCKEKRFVLDLSLLRNVSTENCTWNALSVGRAQLTLRKEEPGVWGRLLKSTKKLAHMHIWWAMHEKYEGDNDAHTRAAAASPTPSAPALSVPAADAAAATPAPASPAVAAITSSATAIPAVSEEPAATAAASVDATAGATAPPAATPSASKRFAEDEDDEEGDVVMAEEEEEEEATRTPVPVTRKASSSTPSSSRAVAASPTVETAAARRRRLAREQAAAEAKAGKSGSKGTAAKASPAAEAAAAAGKGGVAPSEEEKAGAFGLGNSFSTQQLFGQLAGSINARRQNELKEIEESELESMGRVDAWVRSQKAAVDKRGGPPESRAVEKLGIDDQGRSKRSDVRQSSRMKRDDAAEKYEKEMKDLREKLQVDARGNPRNAGNSAEL